MASTGPLEAVAAAHSVTPGAAVVSWLRHQPTVTAPLVSATSPGQLDESLNGARVRLDDVEVQQLDEAAAAMHA